MTRGSAGLTLTTSKLVRPGQALGALICAGRAGSSLAERGELPRRLALWGAAAKDEGAGGGEQQTPVAEPIATP